MSWWNKQPAHPVARVAFNIRPVTSPWGGGNQFVALLSRYLKDNNYAVYFDLRDSLDLIFMIDPRKEGTATFDWEEIRDYKIQHPHTRCLHRINENDKRKGTQYMDDLLKLANT